MALGVPVLAGLDVEEEDGVEPVQQEAIPIRFPRPEKTIRTHDAKNESLSHACYT